MEKKAVLLVLLLALAIVVAYVGVIATLPTGLGGPGRVQVTAQAPPVVASGLVTLTVVAGGPS